MENDKNIYRDGPLCVFLANRFGRKTQTPKGLVAAAVCGKSGNFRNPNIWRPFNSVSHDRSSVATNHRLHRVVRDTCCHILVSLLKTIIIVIKYKVHELDFPGNRRLQVVLLITTAFSFCGSSRTRDVTPADVFYINNNKKIKGWFVISVEYTAVQRDNVNALYRRIGRNSLKSLNGGEEDVARGRLKSTRLLCGGCNVGGRVAKIPGALLWATVGIADVSLR